VKSLLSRRPSPALVIACIALFVSLGGVSYGVATGFIDSREIKNNEIRSLDLRNNEVRTRDLRNNEIRGIDIRNSTVQGRDIALNTVHGEDVREDTLGKVPSAVAADRATTATSATSAATAGALTGGLGMAKLAYVGEIGSAFTKVAEIGGLTITTVANSEIWSRFTGFSNQDDDFDPGDQAILADNPTEGTQGHFTYVGADGRVVSATVLPREELNGVRGTSDCGFFGIAQGG
jgi:hypothetical protein